MARRRGRVAAKSSRILLRTGQPKIARKILLRGWFLRMNKKYFGAAATRQLLR